LDWPFYSRLYECPAWPVLFPLVPVWLIQVVTSSVLAAVSLCSLPMSLNSSPVSVSVSQISPPWQCARRAQPSMRYCYCLLLCVQCVPMTMSLLYSQDMLSDALFFPIKFNWSGILVLWTADCNAFVCTYVIYFGILLSQKLSLGLFSVFWFVSAIPSRIQ
jgi:hypothetical protein